MTISTFVPVSNVAQQVIRASQAPKVLAEFIKEHFGHILLLTGAGCSVDSGIPANAGITGINSKFQEYKNIGNASYNSLETQRQRFWHRAIFTYFLNYIPAQPNYIHKMISELSTKNAFHSHITTNVDGLFQKAKVPSCNFIELYGNFLDPAICYNCQFSMDGLEHLSHLKSINPFFDAHIAQLRATSQPFVGNSLKPTLTMPLTFNGDVVSTNRMPIKFTNLVPCPDCKKTQLKPGANLVNYFFPTALKKRLFTFLGLPTKQQINSDTSANPEDTTEEFNKYSYRPLLNYELDNVSSLKFKSTPKAVLALGTSLDSREIRFVLNMPSLNGLPFIYLSMDPNLELSKLNSQPTSIIDAPIGPTLESALKSLEEKC